MDLKELFQSLDGPGRKRFAETAGTTVDYLSVHLIYGRKMPRRTLLQGLARAADEAGNPMTMAELVEFFMGVSKEAA